MPLQHKTPKKAFLTYTRRKPYPKYNLLYYPPLLITWENNQASLNWSLLLKKDLLLPMWVKTSPSHQSLPLAYLKKLQLELYSKLLGKGKKKKKSLFHLLQLLLLKLRYRGLCQASPASMKLLSWNCKGLSKPATVCTLGRLIRDQSPNILFISETKSSHPQVSATLNRLGFFLMTHVAATGSSGGLVLSWRPGIDLECFVTNKNNISAWCYYDPPYFPWILSCVYGPLNRSERQAF